MGGRERMYVSVIEREESKEHPSVCALDDLVETLRYKCRATTYSPTTALRMYISSPY